MDGMNVQNASEQDTNVSMESQQDTNEVNEPETAPQDGESAESESAQDGSGTAENNADNLPFLEIQHNHERKGLTREEAAIWAQKGIHYEDTYNAIERFATLKGQTVKEFINGLETAEDEAYRNELVEKYGSDDDTVDKLMELRKIDKEKTLASAAESRKKAAEAAEQSVNARIADEFSKMKSEYPELTEFTALPDEVKKAAIDGKSLEHAYLKHIYGENKKIAAAKLKEAEAAKKSTGSMEAGKDGGSGLVDSFLNGFNNN
ncbi:MAG: hypothetical protein J6J13_03270 [Clostridia bacterium]|nr:hypothetical protein [Clostridia bacterium]